MASKFCCFDPDLVSACFYVCFSRRYVALDGELKANSEFFNGLKLALTQAKNDGNTDVHNSLVKQIKKRYEEKSAIVKEKALQYKRIHLEVRDMFQKAFF